MRVMLATPTLFRVPTVEFLMSVQKTMNLLMQQGIALDSAFVGGDCFIGKARNGLFQSFIESWSGPYPADVLVFIDDDQAWDEAAFLRIVCDPHEVIAVAIPKKMDVPAGEPQVFNNVKLDIDDAGQCYVERGMLRVSEVGSGFLAVKRSAVEKLIKAYPRRYAPGDGGLHALHYALFEPKIIWGDTPEMYDELLALMRAAVAEGGALNGNADKAAALVSKITEGRAKIGQFWGEDLLFCQKWKALGEHIWLDPNVTVEHIGRKSWSGNFMHFLQKHAAVELGPMPAATIAVPAVEAPAAAAIPETLAALERLAA